MNEKTYPDETGYDPTIGMGDDIQRFEYLLWFKGDHIKPSDIAEAVTKFLQSRNAQPIQAQYGTIMVPEEDIGEGPHGQYQQVENDA